MKANPELVPFSTATNAYDLLSDVIAAIQSEPRRLDMGQWLCIADSYGGDFSHFPACGTIGCVAGWVIFLTREHQNTLSDLYRPHIAGDAESFARAVMGQNDEAAAAPMSEYGRALERLFNPNIRAEALELDVVQRRTVTDWYGDPFVRVTDPEAGTPEHMQCVVLRIKKFQAEWEEHLRAQPIRPRTQSV